MISQVVMRWLCAAAFAAACAIVIGVSWLPVITQADAASKPIHLRGAVLR